MGAAGMSRVSGCSVDINRLALPADMSREAVRGRDILKNQMRYLNEG